MRILIHTDEYYPTAQACSYRMKVLAEGFIRSGHEVVVITSSNNLQNGVYEQQDERILYSYAVQMKKKTAVMRALNNISFGISSIFKSFTLGKIDIVITTSPPPLVSVPGWLIAKLKGAKLIYDVRDIWPDVAIEMGTFDRDCFYSKVFRSIAFFMYKHADLITTVSNGKVEKIKKYVSEIYNSSELASRKVISLANGFDESILDSNIDDDVVNRFGLKEKFTCVYIGNIGLAQGLESLLDVAAKTKHKDIQFLVFGTGAAKTSLEKRVADEKLNNVRFCGTIPHDKVFSILSYAKLSFVPLKNSNMKDSIPTKIYESLGIGCPVLLVAEGDACNLVEEAKFGICVSPDNISELPKQFDDFVDKYPSYIGRCQFAKNLMLEKYTRQSIVKRFVLELDKYINY